MPDLEEAWVNAQDRQQGTVNFLKKDDAFSLPPSMNGSLTIPMRPCAECCLNSLNGDTTAQLQSFALNMQRKTGTKDSDLEYTQMTSWAASYTRYQHAQHEGA